jgi:hypothetical protein
MQVQDFRSAVQELPCETKPVVVGPGVLDVSILVHWLDESVSLLFLPPERGLFPQLRLLVQLVCVLPLRRRHVPLLVVFAWRYDLLLPCVLWLPLRRERLPLPRAVVVPLPDVLLL